MTRRRTLGPETKLIANCPPSNPESSKGVKNLEGRTPRASELSVPSFKPLSWSKLSWIWHYGFAVFSIASAEILSRWLTPLIGFPGTLFLCAVLLSVWFGGVGPGLLASVLSTLAFHYYFLQSPDPTHKELPRLVIVFLSNILIALLTAAQRSAKESLRRARDDLKHTVQRLQNTNEALHAESRDRNDAEDKLRRSEKKLRDVIETVPALVFSSSPDGSNQLVNRRWVEYSGLSPEATSGSGWQSVVHPDDLETHMKKWQSSLASGEPFENEARHRSASGEYRWFLVRGVPLRDEQGRILKWYGTLTDIEDRKHAEEERQKLHRLQSELAHTNRVSTMGELAAAIAHELKQPIAATITNASAVIRWLKGDQPNMERACSTTTRIIEDGMRASEIIDRLQSLYKKSSPQRELVDVNEIISQMVVLLRAEASRCAVSLRTQLGADLPRTMADRVQIQQVLMNLMLNGVEAMNEIGGLLTVKSELAEQGQLLISVSDNGIGIPDDNADQIFNSFFTTKPQGSGMGLAISRSIIEAHDGRLWATANEGRGASFHFMLPSQAVTPSPRD